MKSYKQCVASVREVPVIIILIAVSSLSPSTVVTVIITERPKRHVGDFVEGIFHGRAELIDV